jgi:hypothetical protein
MDNFDLKKFLVENKLTENSKLNEAPHLDFDAIEKPSEFKGPSNTDTKSSSLTSPTPSPSDVSPSKNYTLTTGDIITADMIRPNGPVSYIFKDAKFPIKIVKVFKFKNSNLGRVVLKFNEPVSPNYDPTKKPTDYDYMQGPSTYSYSFSDISRAFKPPYKIVLPSSNPKSFSISEPRQNTFSPLDEIK